MNWFFIRKLLRNKLGNHLTSQGYRPVVLLTGASSGIGLALARLLATSSEYRIVLSARRTSLFQLRGEFAESERLWLRPLDVTDSTQRNKLLKEINQLWGGVDILINNAGISYRSVMEQMTDADEEKQMAANYFGPVALMRAVLPGMRAKGRGKIINISSVSGMLAMPTMSSYTASKYALEGASEALWYEGRPFGIDVVLLQPGFIRSESFRRVYYSKLSHPSESGLGPYRDYYQNMTPFIERLMNWSLVTPEKMAKLVLRVIRRQRPPLRIAATPDAALFGLLMRLIPRRWFQPFLFICLPKARFWAQASTKKRMSSLKKFFSARNFAEPVFAEQLKKSGTDS
jgi:short-subunit dehydrogenase